MPMLLEVIIIVYYLCALSSPPLRSYLLDGKFFIASALASTLTKLGVRYMQQVEQVQSKNVSFVRQGVLHQMLVCLCRHSVEKLC